MATTSDSTGLVTHSDRLSSRAAELAYSEMARLLDNTTGSKALYERAVEHLPLGVPSSFQAGDPYPIYVCLLYTSPSPRDRTRSRMPSSA